MKNHLVVLASFLLIFGFSTVDSAISPLVRELSRHFGVVLNRVLLLISWATIGTVAGVLLGPALTTRFRVPTLLGAASAGLLAGLAVFLTTDSLAVAQGSRLVFGFSSGTIAACMWWITFYGVPKSHYQAMMAVLMSARPLATALGVPLIGLITAAGMSATPLAAEAVPGSPAPSLSWQGSFWLFGAIMAASGIVLTLALRSSDGEAKQPLSVGRMIRDYIEAFRLPMAAEYYIGFTINRMCYFGFYAVSGIWFITHYNLQLAEISRALFAIGLGEAVINFVVPAIRNRLGHALTFTGSLVVSGIIFPVFIMGGLPYAAALALITLFMILDRIYCMAMVITLPEMFPQAQNKTVFGSLNTLTAWAGLTAIAWLQGSFLDLIGLTAVQLLLIACYVIGSLMLYRVQHRTVLAPARPLTGAPPSP
ncbi:MAG TPA: MFS transporter [Candidatus Ozemobacteraceae bacterium]|nr:MFS transporter [Candidatus Ozemobacteraceae bacterium]